MLLPSDSQIRPTLSKGAAGKKKNMDEDGIDPLAESLIPDPNELFAHAYDFEKLVARLYEQLGYTVVETRGRRKRELGADFIADKDGRTIAVQVKCSVRQVGIAAVRQANNGRRVYQTVDAFVVTNSEFSAMARKEGQRLNVRLMPRSGLLGLLSRLGPEALEEFQRIDRIAESIRSKIREFKQSSLR